MFKNYVKNLWKKISNPKKLKSKKFYGCPKVPARQKNKMFLGHNSITKD
jgi:hypothetical protein